jgi:hypothetical protein
MWITLRWRAKVSKDKNKGGNYMQKTLLGFMDIETTGHDPLASVYISDSLVLIPWHEIIEFGCVFAEVPGFDIKGTYAARIIPEYPKRCLPDLINHYPERAAKGEWDHAISLKTLLQGFFHMCGKLSDEGKILIPGGQNWFFDWSFMQVAIAQNGITDAEWQKFMSYKKFDTGSMALQALWDPTTLLDMSQYSIRSGKLQQALGIEPEPIPHTALNGARQAYEVFKKLSELKLKWTH